MYLSELNFPSGSWYKGFFVLCEIITHDFTLFSSSGDVTGVFIQKSQMQSETQPFPPC